MSSGVIITIIICATIIILSELSKSDKEDK